MTPAAKQPTRFTAIVPQGKVSPYCLATKPDSQYLKRVPIRPARPIKIVFVITFFFLPVFADELSFEERTQTSDQKRKLLITAQSSGTIIRSHQSLKGWLRRTPSPEITGPSYFISRETETSR